MKFRIVKFQVIGMERYYGRLHEGGEHGRAGDGTWHCGGSYRLWARCVKMVKIKDALTYIYHHKNWGSKAKVVSRNKMMQRRIHLKKKNQIYLDSKNPDTRISLDMMGHVQWLIWPRNAFESRDIYKVCNFNIFSWPEPFRHSYQMPWTLCHVSDVWIFPRCVI